MMAENFRNEALFPQLSKDQLETLCPYADKVEFGAGEKVFEEGQPADMFYALLDGEIRVVKHVEGGEQVLAVHVPGEFTGEVSLLSDGLNIATGVATKPSHLLRIPACKLLEVFAAHPEIGKTVLSAMAQRRPEAEAMVRQREKMASLGVLAAGLAHELNNPASAAQSASRQLQETFARQKAVSLKLCERGISPKQHESVAAFMQSAKDRMADGEPLDPLVQSDREEELSDWLDAHDVADAWNLAPTFVTAGITIEQLETVAADVESEALCDMLEWCEATLSINALLREIENSTDRIVTLVRAVKEYSFMDQAPLQEIDVRAGIENTLTILAYKFRKANICVQKEFAEGMPTICAYGSELNQVWTNLLDNAVDALAEKDGKREIRIRTEFCADSVLVEIRDNGGGIPEDVQTRIFEPFFTTKGVGKGTGLGLDIAYRTVVVRHGGDIKVFSEPGETCFRVCLPVAPPKTKEINV
jgi:signal transduction histidine kinase